MQSFRDVAFIISYILVFKSLRRSASLRRLTSLSLSLSDSSSRFSRVLLSLLRLTHHDEWRRMKCLCLWLDRIALLKRWYILLIVFDKRNCTTLSIFELFISRSYASVASKILDHSHFFEHIRKRRANLFLFDSIMSKKKTQFTCQTLLNTTITSFKSSSRWQSLWCS